MDKKLEEEIKMSGNNLHIQVVEILESSGWTTNLSCYYFDDITSKPREIDVIARKEVIIKPSFVHGYAPPMFTYKIMLFIECKYFKKETAFRMFNATREEQESAIIKHGIKDKEDIEKIHRSHHYLKTQKIAKLYDTLNKEEEIFNAITQPVKSLTFFKEQHPEIGFYYPITVYSGIPGLYEIEDMNSSQLQSLTPKKHLIIGLNYSYRSAISQRLLRQYFFIDFIHKDTLPTFLETIKFNTLEFDQHRRLKAAIEFHADK